GSDHRPPLGRTDVRGNRRGGRPFRGHGLSTVHRGVVELARETGGNMSGPTHDADLASLQAALARLTPAPGGINIAQLLFRAGQASVPRRGWAWPCATATSLVLTMALALVLVVRPGPQPVERVVTVYVEPPARSAESVPAGGPPVVLPPPSPES